MSDWPPYLDYRGGLATLTLTRMAPEWFGFNFAFNFHCCYHPFFKRTYYLLPWWLTNPLKNVNFMGVTVHRSDTPWRLNSNY
jgi:hypothetical protein